MSKDSINFNEGQVPFTVDPAIAPVVIGYKNAGLIAGIISPFVPVADAAFTYPVFEKSDIFDIEDTQVGRTGDPTEVQYKSSEKSGLCIPQALVNPVPVLDTHRRSLHNIDPKLRGAENTMAKIMLGHEVRVKNLFQTVGNYGTNVSTLAGTDQWNDYVDSDPDGDITAATDALILGNTQVALIFQTSKVVWDTLRKHPQIVSLVHGAGGDKGTVTADEFKTQYGFDEIVIGKAKYNTAAKGQTPVVDWIWGKHVSIFNRDMTADTHGGITFSMSPKFMDIAQSGFEGKKGALGVEWMKVGHIVTSVITSTDYGYFIQNAIA